MSASSGSTCHVTCHTRRTCFLRTFSTLRTCPSRTTTPSRSARTPSRSRCASPRPSHPTALRASRRRRPSSLAAQPNAPPCSARRRTCTTGSARAVARQELPLTKTTLRPASRRGPSPMLRPLALAARGCSHASHSASQSPSGRPACSAAFCPPSIRPSSFSSSCRTGSTTWVNLRCSTMTTFSCHCKSGASLPTAAGETATSCQRQPTRTSMPTAAGSTQWALRRMRRTRSTHCTGGPLTRHTCSTGTRSTRRTAPHAQERSPTRAMRAAPPR
mmetsp:Transcript_15800/g.47939  ORF Transcript_15800/g.47939 Transcript_15800/m.47939 type:complete len:274 (+) Transcript_15800:574-1395(+)